MLRVAESNIKHQIPPGLLDDLAASDPILLPLDIRITLENGVVVALAPKYSIGTRRITNGIWFTLFPSGVPHSVEFGFLVPNHMRTHQRDFFPRSIRGEHRLFTHSLPHDPVSTGRIANRRVTVRLARIPHTVNSILFN